MNILFIFDVPLTLREHLRSQLADCQNLNLLFMEEGDDDFLAQHGPTADVMVGWRPEVELLENAAKLKLFVNPGAGMDKLAKKLLEHLPAHVQVVNSHGNSLQTAQHVVAMTLGLSNHLVAYHNAMVEGKWRPLDTLGLTNILYNKTIGFLGYGHINQKAHQYMSGFDVEFCALRRSWDKPAALDVKQYTSDRLIEFLEAVDVCIVAVPHTDATNNLITKRELEALGSDGLIINVSRGAVINEQDFYEALKNKTITGAGIDVWYNYTPEPDADGKKYPSDYPFHELDNVLLSPHRAAAPYAETRRWWDVIENLKRVDAGRNDFLNVVDLAAGY